MKLTDMDKLQKYFIHNIRDAEVKGINSKVALIEKIAYGLRTEGT
jgi:transposase